MLILLYLVNFVSMGAFQKNKTYIHIVYIMNGPGRQAKSFHQVYVNFSRSSILLLSIDMKYKLINV